MRFSLAYAIRALITSPIEITESHSKLYTIGVNTHANKSYVYMMTVSVSMSNSQATDFDLKFYLKFIGTFSNTDQNNDDSGSEFLTDSEKTAQENNETTFSEEPPLIHGTGGQRRELIAFLLCALFDTESKVINNYLLTHHHSSSLYESSKKLKPSTSRITSCLRTRDFGVLHFKEDESFKYISETRNVLKGHLFLKPDSTCPILNVFIKTHLNNSAEFGNIYSIVNDILTPYLISTDITQICSIAGDVDLNEYTTRETTRERQLEALECLIDILIQIKMLSDLYRAHNDIKPQNIVRIKDHWFLIDHEMHLSFNKIIDKKLVDSYQ